MSTQFDDDVFTSHSSKDKSRHDGMRELANRLKQDGRRVWLDEWKIQPGDVIELKSSQGLECSRIPSLACGSAEAVGRNPTHFYGGGNANHLRGYNQAELNRILRLTRQNQNKLLEAWNDHFSQ